MAMKIDKYKPAVSGSLLVLLAGAVWICAGAVLLFSAALWLSAPAGSNPYPFAAAGVLLALLIHHFGFLKIVDKNLNRILSIGGKRCLFSFIPWKSYLVIAVMVAMGVLLRHSAIPGRYLAICYIGIGLALVLSAMRYIRVFFREIRRDKTS